MEDKRNLLRKALLRSLVRMSSNIIWYILASPPARTIPTTNRTYAKFTEGFTFFGLPSMSMRPPSFRIIAFMSISATRNENRAVKINPHWTGQKYATTAKVIITNTTALATGLWNNLANSVIAKFLTLCYHWTCLFKIPIDTRRSISQVEFIQSSSRMEPLRWGDWSYIS